MSGGSAISVTPPCFTLPPTALLHRYDPDQTRVELTNKASLVRLEGWLTIDPLPLLESGKIRATSRVTDVLKKETVVHIVAVPTERKGSPLVGSAIPSDAAISHNPSLRVGSGRKIRHWFLSSRPSRGDYGPYRSPSTEGPRTGGWPGSPAGIAPPRLVHRSR